MALLHYNTITPQLKKVLLQLMEEPLFNPFRLVGGTNLSLRFGYRNSVDVDLFTDENYGSLDYNMFENYLKAGFPYYNCNNYGTIVGFGRSYYVGNSSNDYIKVDLMYSDPFIRGFETINGIRMASIEDIIAMKMNVISRGGRKKDFWDIHYLLNNYSLKEMLSLHEERYPWEHDTNILIHNLTNFKIADNMPDPVCLLLNNWDDIKIDLIDSVEILKHERAGTRETEGVGGIGKV